MAEHYMSEYALQYTQAKKQVNPIWYLYKTMGPSS